MATTTPAPPATDAPAKEAKAAKKGKDGKNGAEGAKPKGKKKLIIGVVLLLVLGGGYKMTLGKAKVDPNAAPDPGVVLKLDPITLNLAQGHYLKLTMALQYTAAASAAGGEEGGGAEPDGSKALDLAIDQLSNKRIADLNTSAARNYAKEKLLTSVEEAYHHEVMDIYFTEWVMQ